MNRRSKSSLLYIAYNFYVYSAKVATFNGTGNTSVLDDYVGGKNYISVVYGFGIMRLRCLNGIGWCVCTRCPYP